MSGSTDRTTKIVQAGLITWLLPGAGHFWLGHRGLGAVFFLAITLPFWTGAAVGGVKYNIDPRDNKWLFLGEIGAGGYTLVGLLLARTIHVTPDTIADYKGFYPESDVAMIYLSTAGLLNLMVILDAMTRAQTGGLPTYYRELVARETSPPEQSS